MKAKKIYVTFSSKTRIVRVVGSKAEEDEINELKKNRSPIETIGQINGMGKFVKESYVSNGTALFCIMELIDTVKVVDTPSKAKDIPSTSLDK